MQKIFLSLSFFLALTISMNAIGSLLNGEVDTISGRSSKQIPTWTADNIERETSKMLTMARMIGAPKDSTINTIVEIVVQQKHLSLEVRMNELTYWFEEIGPKHQKASLKAAYYLNQWEKARRVGKF